MSHATRREDRLHRRSLVFRSYKAKADARRRTSERFADWLTYEFGTLNFLLLNAAFFLVWIGLNLGWIPAIEVFDPFPFGLLTMIVSLEAIFLSIVVLICQNRAARVADLREEIDLQINLMAEREVTKVLTLLVGLLEKNGIDVSADQELQDMIRPMDDAEMERRLEQELRQK